MANENSGNNENQNNNENSGGLVSGFIDLLKKLLSK